MLFQRLLEQKEGLPLVMGILNVTPDSFSDGGRYQIREQVIEVVLKMQQDGADLVDLGGESTRPGAVFVSEQEEMDRVLPAIGWIREVCDLPISVDTYKTAVMAEAIKCDVAMINDVNALQSPGAIEVVAAADVAVCLMHKKGAPVDMQDNPKYLHVVDEVVQFLTERILSCQQLGIQKNNIFIDPGFGFGKSLSHNVELFKSLEQLAVLSCPLLVGVSRKAMIGALQGDSGVEERLCGSVAAAVIAMLKGARVLRVHDVRETVHALKVAKTLW